MGEQTVLLLIFIFCLLFILLVKFSSFGYETVFNLFYLTASVQQTHDVNSLFTVFV